MTVTNRFLSNINKYNLIDKNDTIIIGSSGGPDSQFLIYLLNEIKNEYNLTIILAHLNHLHRKEASFDEKLVIDTGEKLGLKVEVRKASMDELAKANKISPEDAGRRLRYEFFNDIASSYRNSKIAVAHNMDDQAETMLFRMARGTGLDGLAGMDYKNKNIIRPILSFKKSEILEYLNQNNISYAIDATNLENDYSRNYIRNEIFPKISEINPNAINNFFNLSDIIKNDLAIIDEIIDKKYKEIVINEKDYFVKFDKGKFEDISYPIKTRLIRIAIFKLTGDTKNISKENIEDFINIENLQTGKKIIKDKLVFQKNYNSYELMILNREQNYSVIKKINLDEEIVFNGRKIKTSIVFGKKDKSRNVGYFDLDKISFPLTIRTRENGDKFRPIGMDHKKKLKDFFIDEKIDKSIRDQIPIILSNDDIIWIVGYRISEQFKVDSGTKNILKIEVEDD
ncbi:tRNA lysidine(34) synthetase TilS [Anaerococcus sp. mt242]|uniref:tRNA lysidine(34) synthetase TilS n=1 Tax=Anaerococcus sp. mt242 TaxID=2661917 RepID=UPI0019326B8D|nr:tRNA lysidine(34) synthetase TilS [Anaerococcus sp. mt242]MBM0045905.1 tRNA lysidine(34) synthetase TilS [Anaerococcus sp. mt242]